ncbi:MAG: permease-like cell division protein FtsX [Candidatus Latescibacteria bacterium]|nr:permease-like cell division protein FtsX [Candidatus Latescibacterota bacterium]
MALLMAFREAMRGLRRTGMAGVVSGVTTAVSLMVLGIFVLLVGGGLAIFESLQGRIEVDVYLDDGLRRTQALHLARELEAMPGVASVRYVDKVAAAEEFRSMFGDGLLSAVSRNPLPASVRVVLRAGEGMVNNARAVAEAAAGRKGVESVDAGEAWLTSLDRAREAVTWIGVSLGVVLCLACTFAVGNTAKLLVLAQRDAIEVMRMVGATAGFIRLTVLMGGAVLGCAGGILAVLALWGGSQWWAAWIPGETRVALVYPGLIGLGVLLGILGSWVSLNRVLRALA